MKKHYLIGRLSRGHSEPMLIGRVEADSFENAAGCLGRNIVPPPTGYTGTLRLGTAHADESFSLTFEELQNTKVIDSIPIITADTLTARLK